MKVNMNKMVKSTTKENRGTRHVASRAPGSPPAAPATTAAPAAPAPAPAVVAVVAAAAAPAAESCGGCGGCYCGCSCGGWSGCCCCCCLFFTSFGPVLFVVAPHRYICSLIYHQSVNRYKKTQKNSLMAQTTRFTSFGPVLLIVAPRKCIRSFRISSIPVRWLVDIINTNNHKKKLTNGPNDAKRIIWARYPHRSLSVPST